MISSCHRQSATLQTRESAENLKLTLTWDHTHFINFNTYETTSLRYDESITGCSMPLSASNFKESSSYWSSRAWSIATLSTLTTVSWVSLLNNLKHFVACHRLFQKLHTQLRFHALKLLLSNHLQILRKHYSWVTHTVSVERRQRDCSRSNTSNPTIQRRGNSVWQVRASNPWIINQNSSPAFSVGP